MKIPARRLLRSLAVLSICTFSLFSLPSRAFDLAEGLMYAVPAPKGVPSMDGSDKGWDLSAAEPIWQSNQFAKQLHGSLALNYDDNNLYVYAKIHTAAAQLKNPHSSVDPFWAGDEVELRLSSDPEMKFPISNGDPKDHVSPQICHIAFWKDTNDNKDYINIQYGGMHGGGQGKATNPPGSKVVFTQGDNEYVMQVALPWSALNVPGGKNPFKPGSRMTAIFGIHWAQGTWFYAVNAVYSTNPGDFAFMQWQDWGQVEFSPTGNLKPHHQTMEEALAVSAKEPVGVPITVNVPGDGKLSINIVGDNGAVLREVIGGQPVKAGEYTARWDGRDQWGFALTPGTYHWAAYFSHGLTTKLIGFVGSSGTPPWPTPDGKGGWGGDHGVPTSVAADDSGIYFGWLGSEAQRQIVKIDYAGNTLWRATPFVQGGFGDLRALASNGKYVFGAYSGLHPTLVRVDPKTGLFVLFAGSKQSNGTSVPIGQQPAAASPSATPAPPQLVLAPAGSLPAQGGYNGGGRTPQPGIDGTEPECIGLAATDKEVFASVYSQNLIQVIDPETGAPTRTLSCPRPRGLALDSKGNLYAVCFGTDQPAQVVRFDGVTGSAKPVVTADLVAPVGVAVDASGQIWVTDEGTSQQIKAFSASGSLVKAYGKEGGRPWAGTYDPTSYRDPSAIAADSQGGIVVAESSIPKIFSRIEIASGKTLARWFGAPGYGVENIGDPVDPMTSYYPFEPEGFARATVPAAPAGADAQPQLGFPDAYWVPTKAGMAGVGTLYGEGFPSVSILSNGKKYFIDDANPHAVCLIDGDNMIPLGHLDCFNAKDRRNSTLKAPQIDVWINKSGKNEVLPEDVTTLTTVDDKPLASVSQGAGTMWMDKDGNAYLITNANSILKIPSDGFAPNGAILWNPSKASYVVPALIASKLKGLGTAPRSGAVGVRVDDKGNLYTCITTTVPALTPALASKISAMFPDIPQSQWGAYASDELAKSMHEGLGHTAESNLVKFAKYGPDGKLIWMAGRKATADPNPGEMYHTWSMNDLVNDEYVSMCSEWGTIYFYTSDGFFVDTLMNDPNALAEAGPYTFGSENFSGRIQAYPKLGKVFAYDQGGIYTVDGFDPDLKVSGEQRFNGTVVLDKVYEAAPAESQIASTLKIVPISGDAASAAAWTSVPSVTLMRNNAPLAIAQITYDTDNLYARIHVTEDSPMRNGGNDPSVVFKSGDVVGLDLGPAGDRNRPSLGDLRILAAKMQGQDRLIAMKPVSKLAKQPQQYITPASGTKNFDFVGDIPGGKAVLTADADGKGYTALITVPRSFLEFKLAPGTPLKGDIEVLLAGIKSQGLQATSRNWLYSGGQSQTTMTDDIPTEAWLYPQFWGDVSVK